MIIDNLKTPYYAVVFSTILTDNVEGYEAIANKMELLAKKQPGYLGVESARNSIGVTVSYWSSLEAINAWKNNVEHIEARELGRSKWYKKYRLRICKVEREYGFEN
ncbi:antibiotic biosynthesis monooxygenase [uncultured Polaribacter sp.]|uniref:antibiotic biosynthesis monooxygenase family protein n=1 Tax=uncultured Polaribacter sp. TaxID=174711 RepID=UPI0026261863|nr:antibiotic biosynthesis monooxygenase [uncultured Polaribacter sp.]